MPEKGSFSSLSSSLSLSLASPLTGPPYLVLCIVVLVLLFYLILKAHCRSLHGQTSQRHSEQKHTMQRFAVILFALVAVFAIIVPSSAKALSQVKRETNADRFARGLPPLAPSRRSTAKRTQHSQTSVSYALNIFVPRNAILGRLPIPDSLLVAQAAFKFVITGMVARVSVTSRMDQVARKYISFLMPCITGLIRCTHYFFPQRWHQPWQRRRLH